MDDHARDFATLELAPGATGEEIKAAYLDLVKVWHPDRYAHESPRLRQRAEDKLKAINSAYERLRQTRLGGGAAAGAAAPPPAEVRLKPMRFGDEWGYVNAEGRLIIRPQFAAAAEFSEGLGRIGQRHPVYRVVYGYVDGDGLPVINAQFVDARDFHEGLAGAVMSAQWGYIDRTGGFRIMPLFERCRDFSGGYAAVRQRGAWGYIDQAGRMLVPPRYDEAREFQAGWAWVRLGDQWGRLNPAGEVFFLPPQELPPPEVVRDAPC